MLKRYLATLVVIALAAMLGACGGSDSSSDDGGSGGGASTSADAGKATIDLGDGQQVTVDRGKPKIAFFTAGSSNDILKVVNSTAQDVAGRLGVELQVFDPGFDAAKQFNQIQNELQRKRYDAFIVTPLNGDQQCKLLTRQAPDAGIVVSTMIVPICGRTYNRGEQIWATGTLNFIEGHDLQDYQDGWMRQVDRMLRGEHHVGVLLGPPLIGLSRTFKKALDEMADRRPDLHIDAELETDYTTPDGLAKTQTMLQAHPEIDVILCVYSDLARGAIKAIQAAGKQGQIQVFDEGGSNADIAQIKSGDLTATSEFNPIADSTIAIQEMVNAFAGRQGERYLGYLNDQGSEDAPFMITKDNVDSFTPKY
jgi:ribose transport system substrate-binding protein